jgi:molybdopterin converting factor small subunit
MPRVFIPAPLRDVTAGQTEVVVEARSVDEVIEQLESQYPGIRARLCDGDQLAVTLQVAVGQVMTRSLSTPVAANDEVHFIPAIGGG